MENTKRRVGRVNIPALPGVTLWVTLTNIEIADRSLCMRSHGLTLHKKLNRIFKQMCLGIVIMSVRKKRSSILNIIQYYLKEYPYYHELTYHVRWFRYFEKKIEFIPARMCYTLVKHRDRSFCLAF